MHLGLDLDGVLSKRSPVQGSYVRGRILCGILRLLPGNPGTYWILNHTEAREDIDIIRDLSTRHRITIITARPIDFHRATEQWLTEVAQISFEGLYCVGLAKDVPYRKYVYADQVGVDVFIDDTKENVEYFREQELFAHLFEGWETAREIIESYHNE